MKFVYQYRTSDNVIHCGEVAAADREEAFSRLRSQGIRPARVEEARGLLNKLFGKGKRWIAICSLSCICVGFVFAVVRSRREIDVAMKEVEDLTLYEARGQIYGAPSVMRRELSTGWRESLTNEIDRYLSAYAIPGYWAEGRGTPIPKHFAEGVIGNVPIDSDDLYEVAKMKRMVNGLRREARAYISAGGTAEGYAKRLERRQKEESLFLARVKRELEGVTDDAVFQERNRTLRAMGLPMIDNEEVSNSEAD